MNSQDRGVPELPAKGRVRMNDIATNITAVTALVAVILGPIVSVYIVRRQIRASVISTNRQAWIDDLRGAIAEYLKAKEIIVLIAMGTGLYDKTAAQRETENMIMLIYRIQLLINPNEHDHAKLATLLLGQLGEVAKSCQPGSGKKDIDIGQSNAEIILLAQSILKREWERVKRGN
jgi:hypothetical protein